ncbi:TraB/GumN family protein [soil metagenome]
MVFKVSPKEGKGVPLYLAGSIHLLRKSDYPLAPAYEAAYEASERVVFEILQGEKDAAAQTAMLAAGTYPEGETIDKHIGAPTYRQLQAHLGKLGIPKGGMDRFRPWMVALTIAVMEYMKMGAQPELGLDLHFEKRAKADDKERRGLETMEFQIGLFTSLSDEEQLEMLQKTLAEVDKMEEMVGGLLAAWKAGDTEKIEATLFAEAQKYEEIMDELIYSRNKAWIGPIKEMLADGKPTMVVVGAGHLVGKGSVVDLLQQEGYSVEQMTHADTDDGGDEAEGS